MSNKVVIALCYRALKDVIIVPSCPFCFCSHTHHLPIDILSMQNIKHENGELTEFNEECITKTTDCMYMCKTYALELRNENEITTKEPKLCMGITKKNTPCKTKLKSNVCVCKRHYNQMEKIIQDRINKLFIT